MTQTVKPLPANLLTDDAIPSWMNKGDKPGSELRPRLLASRGSLASSYTMAASSRRSGLSTLVFMALYAFAAVLICRVGWGYRMSFGDSFIPFLGKPNISLDAKYLLEQTFNNVKFPNATMIYFQFVFAAITLILVTGALLGRMNFPAWMLLVPLWLTLLGGVGWMTWSLSN